MARIFSFVSTLSHRAKSESPDLIYALQVRAESTVYAENASIDYRAQCEIIEDFAAPPPDVAAAVLPLALVIEAIDLGYLPGLVVSTYKRDALRVPHLKCEEQEKGLHTVITAIHKVTCKSSEQSV